MTTAQASFNGTTPRRADREETTPADRVRELAVEVTREAIANYHRAKAHSDRAEALRDGLTYEDAKWGTLPLVAADEAEGQLVRAILAWDGSYTEGDTRTAERRRWDARGVIDGGKLYLAASDANDEYMTLRITDASSIVDLAAVVKLPDEPGEDQADEEEATSAAEDAEPTAIIFA